MNLRSSLLRGFAPAVTALALVASGSATANAAALLTTASSCQIGTATCITPGITNASGPAFSQSGGFAYNFVFSNVAAAKTTGAAGSLGTVVLDAATTADPLAPTSSLLGLDSDFDNGAVTFNLTTIVGNIYTLNFDFAGTQQAACPACVGPSNDNVAVSVDGVSKQSNPVGGFPTSMTIPSQGFSGWFTAAPITFTGSGSDTISFFATSTTPNVPAFALVDNIQLTNVAPPAPEPNSLILLGTGLAGLGGFVRSRFVKSAHNA